MMAKKRILSWLVAASLALSLLPAAALAADETQEPEKKTTISDTILEPGKEDIIEDADKNAQDLIDGTYNALNPVENGAKPAEGKDVNDILVPETDKDGNEVKDEDGNSVLVVKDSEENGVLTKADKAVEDAQKTKTDVEKTLSVTVTVETEEGETKEEKKPVDAVIAEEAAKAAEAKTAVDNAAAAAEAAVANEDQEALDKAKNDAIQAVADATAAYNNAQNTFDSVVEKLLTEEDDEKAIADKTLELLAAKNIAAPGEDATDEEKAAYEIERVNAENAAKLELANARIGTKYANANQNIEDAKTALTAAEQALTAAKTTYDHAANAILDNENLSDIAAYVDMFKNLQADEDTAKKVADDYKAVDTATGAAEEAAKVADGDQRLTSEERDDRMSASTKTIGDYKNVFGNPHNPQLVAAVRLLNDQNKIIADQLKLIKEAEPGTDTSAYWDKIAEAEKKMNQKQAFNYKTNGDYVDYSTRPFAEGTAVQRSAYEILVQRDSVIIFVSQDVAIAADQLLKDLDAAKAARAQLKAEEDLKKTLAGLSNLGYQEALEVVKGFTTIEDCDALKDAQEKLAAQKQAAEDAKAKVDEATKAYEAAKKAVEEAQKKLNGLNPEDLNAQVVKDQLAAAKGQLDKAKKDKEDAEEKQKEIEDLVIEIEQEIEEIITPDADDGDTDDDGTAIADGIVPLALMPTRGELMNYLYVRAGSPAARASTFTDVPADHDFALAIGWAQANGIATAYEDGTFDPDNFVIAADMTAFLTRYAAFANMEMPTLATMAGLEDDAIVENADEILAEFFGD